MPGFAVYHHVKPRNHASPQVQREEAQLDSKVKAQQPKMAVAKKEAAPRLSMKERVEAADKQLTERVTRIKEGLTDERVRMLGELGTRKKEGSGLLAQLHEQTKKCSENALGQQMGGRNLQENLQTIIADRDLLQKILLEIQDNRPQELLEDGLPSGRLWDNTKLKQLMQRGKELGLSANQIKLIVEVPKAEGDALIILNTVNAEIAKLIADEKDLNKAQAVEHITTIQDEQVARYDEALAHYRKGPSSLNAANVREAIVGLMKADELAAEHGVAPKMDIKVFQAILLDHHKQYKADLDNYRFSQSYDNAVALQESATILQRTDALLRTNGIAEKYNFKLNDMNEVLAAVLNEVQEVINIMGRKEQAIRDAHELRATAYNKALEAYANHPSAENAEDLKEAIEALLEADKLVERHRMAPKMNIDTLKETLAKHDEQYKADLKGYIYPTYSNAAALLKSATAFVMTVEMLRIVGPVDNETDEASKKAGESMLTAEARMERLKEEIKNSIKDDLEALTSEQLKEMDQTDILNRRDLILSHIEDITVIQLEEMANGRRLSRDLKKWARSCLDESATLLKKLEEREKVLLVIDEVSHQRKGLLSSLKDAIYALIQKLSGFRIRRSPSVVEAPRPPVAIQEQLGLVLDLAHLDLDGDGIDLMDRLVDDCEKDLESLKPLLRKLRSTAPENRKALIDAEEELTEGIYERYNQLSEWIKLPKAGEQDDILDDAKDVLERLDTALDEIEKYQE